MISLALSVLPIALVLMAGYVLAKSGAIPKDQWSGIETLSFRVLTPAILIVAITGSDLSVGRFGVFTAVLIGAIALLSLIVFAVKWLIRLPNPAFTSLYQTTIRWNAFVALAAGAQFLDADSVAIIGVAMAVSIPLINVLSIVVVSAFGPAELNWRAVWMRVLKNPLVQACVLGLVLNMAGVTLPLAVQETLQMIGAGAIGVGLLSVGAGVSLRRLGTWRTEVAIAAILRPVLAPVLVWAVAGAVGLPADQAFVAVLVFAVPAAANGYIIARQMGGDAELYADVLTWQVMLTVVALPLWAAVLL